ncbi:MAG: MFS transporter [SAR202 cluster bacterium]|nr:MFS transporter [SAR202 cluster bacterium]|tara:strand:- start:7136 stop:8341 length:1206 start_codon:yes stop_codon:yes gene_type:complete
MTSHRFYPYLVIGIAVLSHGGFALSGQGFTPFYPFIQDDFNLSRTQVGIITGTIFGAATITSTGFGWLIDHFGARLMSGITMVASGIAVASMVFANSFSTVLIVAAIMGSLRPVGHPAGTKAILDWVSLRQRATAMSIKQAGNPLLAAIAAALIPPIAIAYGWQFAAVALGIFISIGGIFILAVYRDKETSIERKRSTKPFWQGIKSVITSRDLSFAMAFGFPLVGVQVATLTYFILYVHDDLGVSIIVGGSLLAILQVSSIVMRITWGVISDTLGKGRRKPILLVAGLLTIIVLLTVAFLPQNTPYWGLVLVAIGLGATATSWVSLHSVLLSEIAKPSEVGTAIGYASTLSRSAIVITPPFFGWISDVSNYQTAWLAMAIGIVVALFFLGFVKEKPHSNY